MKLPIAAFSLLFAVTTYAASTSESSPIKVESTDAAIAEIETALGKSISQYPIMVLKEAPTPKLISQLAGALPGCAKSGTPVQIIASEGAFADRVLAETAGKARKKLKGLHIIVDAPDVDLTALAKISKEKGVVFHVVETKKED